MYLIAAWQLSNTQPRHIAVLLFLAEILKFTIQILHGNFFEFDDAFVITLSKVLLTFLP